jgi:hypothetical protein
VGAVLSSTFLGLWFELRVIFGSYGAYVTIPQPFSHILITLGVYTIILSVALHSLNLLHKLGVNGVRFLLFVTATSLSISFGVPLLLYFVLLAGLYVFGSFYFDKSIYKYILFATAATLVVTWFCIRTFWFIDFTFHAQPALSAQYVTILLIISLILAFAIPGLAIVNEVPAVTSQLLITHAAIMFVLERTLYNSMADVYPLYLVALTTLLGSFLCHRLHSQRRILFPYTFLLPCLYITKLAIAFPHPYAPVAVFGLSTLLSWGVLVGSKQALSAVSFFGYSAVAFVVAWMSVISIAWPWAKGSARVRNDNAVSIALFVVSFVLFFILFCFVSHFLFRWVDRLLRIALVSCFSSIFD